MKLKYKSKLKSGSSARIVLLLCLFLPAAGCKKLIEIPPPVGTITTSQVFSTDAQATSAAAGMYYPMINSRQILTNYGMTVFCGMSADELIPFDQTDVENVQFLQNQLLSTNGTVSGNFWDGPYSVLYSANSIIENLNSSTTVHPAVKSELIGEAKFVRAFLNFYLVNVFGDIPLVTTINWRKTNTLGQSPSSQVYNQIISDLKDAQNLLANDYAFGQGKRIVPNKWAATALLARVYLYTGDYSDAIVQATAVINNSSLYSLSPDLNNVFLVNSNEAIWQLAPDPEGGISSNATPEGYTLVPSAGSPPYVYLTSQLLAAFEPGDQRRVKWVDSISYDGTSYYFPYKYKVGPDQITGGTNFTEYYMVLRLSEQYLIRAEAEANSANAGNISLAINDLNIIRRRAGLPAYAGALTKTDVLNAISHENQIEFFAEWGHRWLDLKRSGQAAQVLSAEKGFQVSQNSLLFPIPIGEITIDHNLTQNPGY